MTDLSNQVPKAFDLDTDGGTFDLIQGTVLRSEAAGGSINALTIAALLAEGMGNPTISGIQAFPMLWNGTTWDRQKGTAGKMDVATELSIAAVLSDALANPTTAPVGAHLMGYDRVNNNWTRVAGIVDGEVVGALNAGFLLLGSDGANYQAALMSASGRLSVDVNSGAGADTPTNPATESILLAAVASLTEADIDMVGDIPGKTLTQVRVWSSAAFRCRLYTLDDTTEGTTPLAVGGAEGFHTDIIRPTHRTYWVAPAAGAGNQRFRLEVKNLNAVNPADFYVQFDYEDA